MKKVLYLRKTSNSKEVVLDPFYYVGKEFIFDSYYFIKVLSVKKDNFTISLEIEGESCLDRIPINDFLNYIVRGTMVEKTGIKECDFESFDEYYDLISSFLLINYNIMIVSIDFDWESEFERKTPVEIACKIALGIIKK